MVDGTSGTGTITRPKLAEILLLPQHPYMLLGTLRNHLLYPQSDMKIADDELLRVLKLVNLSHIAEGGDSLDGELDWSKTLSIGEQQRLCFARLLIIKPKYAILDEATSTLDPVNEENLYHRQLAIAFRGGRQWQTGRSATAVEFSRTERKDGLVHVD